MAKLKPCPFCGMDVHLDNAYSYFRDIVIYCDGCDMVFTLDDCSTSELEIAQAWNKRALDKNVPRHFKGESMRCPICDTPQDKLIKNLANPAAHEVVYCWNCGQAIEVMRITMTKPKITFEALFCTARRVRGKQ